MTEQEHLESIRQTIRNLPEILFVTDLSFCICDMNMQAKRMHPSIRSGMKITELFPLNESPSDKLLRAMLSRQPGQPIKVSVEKKENQARFFMVTLLKSDDSQYYCWEEENIVLRILKKEQRLYRNLSQLLINESEALERLKGNAEKKALEYDCCYGRYRSRMNDANCDTYIYWLYRQIEQDPCIVNVRELLKLRVDSLNEKATGSVRLVFKDETKDSKRYFVRLDELLFHKSLAFILANAYEALAKKEKGTVQIRCHLDKNDIVIEVEDNGNGIRPELLDHVYDPLITGPEKSGHLGMGLTLAKALIEEQKGNISIESKYHRGTIVTIRFPLATGTRVKERTTKYDRGFDKSNWEMDAILSEACQYQIPELEKKYGCP